jgi:hypothetical protein
MMDFLDKINWGGDDGVFWPMLNDFRRNQYYDKIMQNTVKDRLCVDVGFGTGLLSLLALKHGAAHIIAYEKNHNRYLLGQHIIQHLGLQEKIDLHHSEYTWQTDTDKNAVVISETVNSQIWGEGLWNSLPRKPGQTWLPNSVYMDIVAEPIPWAFATDLFRGADHFGFFNPAVDIDPRFVALVNQLAKKTPPRRDKIIDDDIYKTTVWGGWTYVKFSQFEKPPVAGYELSINDGTLRRQDGMGSRCEDINFATDDIVLRIPLNVSQDLPILIVPRVGFKHHTTNSYEQLALDTAESWGCGCIPYLVTKPGGILTIKHDVRSGTITYLESH